MLTKNFRVKGMHCASCATIITRTLAKIPGVENSDVNFASEKANVNFDPAAVSVGKMNQEIAPLGYELVEEGNESHIDHSAHASMNTSKEEKLAELEKERAKVQFVLPIALLTFVIMMWDLAAKVIQSYPNLPIPMAFLNVLLLILATVVVFWIGKPFLRGVGIFLTRGAANMDTLIGIGTLTAYLYSAALVLFPILSDILRVPNYVYFDVTIVVIGFVVLGKYLEARARLRTGEAIEKLLNLQAKTAVIERNGHELEVPLTAVQVGDIVIVKPGTKIPVDGEIVEGTSSIDESMVTGESVPVDKKSGDKVIGSTINKQGAFRFQATRVGSDTVLAQIITMVEQAQSSKAPIQALADKISGIFVPIVLAIAALTVVLWLTVGSAYLGSATALSFAILTFVGVLVIACPCALGLATPTAIIVGVGKGAQHGILIKGAESLEKLSKVNTIVFDKTGTITKGQLIVTNIISFDKKYSNDEIISIAASLEQHSEHPLAQAIVNRIGNRSSLQKVTHFRAIEGVGVEGQIARKKVSVHKPLNGNLGAQEVVMLQSEGKTVVLVTIGKESIGCIALSDTIKEGVPEMIRLLHKQKVQVYMLTGDNRKAAEYIAKQAGIDGVFAEVMPHEKAQKIIDLQRSGNKVAMVGDGINDAPALVQADVGIAMATGTDVAIESAGITLLGGDVRKIPQALKLAHATMSTIHQNLFWAFIYNVVGIPVAAGILYPIWGILLNPIFAGAAMAFSSVSVVLNSLRLKAKRLS